MKGSRIHGIVRELGNENIDVINLQVIFIVYYKSIKLQKCHQSKLMKKLKGQMFI
jgi:transcription antitermination factor NusA-like protein